MKIYLLLLIALLFAAACSTPAPTTEENIGSGTPVSDPNGSDQPNPESPATVNASPQDAVKAFIAAVKAKDEAGVKGALSEKTYKMLLLEVKLSGKKDATLFDSEDFEDIGDMPEVRNEKIDGEKATLEVREKGDEEWTPLPLVKVGGSWRLAYADEAYDKSYEELSKKAGEKVEDPKNAGSDTNSGGKASKAESDS